MQVGEVLPAEGELLMIGTVESEARFLEEFPAPMTESLLHGTHS